MNILVIKSSSLGDIIHTFSAIGLIKKLGPNSCIDWVVETPSVELVKAHPDVNEVFAIDSKKWRKSIFSQSTIQEMTAFKKLLQRQKYDIVFDFQGNCKSGLMTWLSNSPLKVGFAKGRVPEWPNILASNRRYLPPLGANIRDDYQFLVHSHFKNFTPYEFKGVSLNLNPEETSKLKDISAKLKEANRPSIMVCAGSNWKNKQLTNDALFAFLEMLMQKHPCQFVFVWGSEKEKINAEELSSRLKHAIVLDKMSLPLLQHTMSSVKLVIAMDSLPLHLAATTQTPTFSVFGASLATKYKPTGNHHFAIQGPCPYGQTFEMRCPKLRSCATGACIRSLPAQTIFNEYLDFAEWKGI